MPDDREFLRFYALVVNRVILELKLIQSLQREAENRAIRQSLENILKDGRRLVSAYRIWRRKTAYLQAPDFYRAVRTLVWDAVEIFLG